METGVAMLTAEEREVVIHAIALYLDANDQPRATLTTLVDDHDFAARLPSGQSPLEWARITVTRCEEDAWRHLPPWLYRLLSHIQITLPELDGLIQRIKAKPPEWCGPAMPDPLDSIWLPAAGMPFVNRKMLRAHLRAMCTAPEAGAGAGTSRPPAVLVVNGPEKSGRTYTVDLLEHYVRHQRVAAFDTPLESRPAPPWVALARVPRHGGSTTMPTDLTTILAEAMLVDTASKPAGIATPDRMNEYLCQWLLEEAGKTRKQWWLVIDRLHEPDLNEDTVRFVAKLAEQVARRNEEPAIRLVLIGFPPALLANTSSVHEDVGPIGEVDLEPFFDHLLSGATGTEMPPAAVKMAVFLALKDLPANGQRLAKLNARLRDSVALMSHA
ncbi:hypothetical protein ACTMTJ_16760 [Phytohabitans sp. LJ34]|uniref:hypothetical protein n=1 Tax=Phytohabitans sp. LJ34 TaxID=3452217 RepID=UPI003F8C3DFD